MKQENLNKIKFGCLKSMLAMYKKAEAGHIGSSLSCLDILISLYFDKMNKNDKFVLSKGHAAGALYTVLAKKRIISSKFLSTFCEDGTLFAAHPPCGNNKINGILFGTGSLGHGLSLASGIAFSNNFSRNKFHVYCLLSEGDCNEGSTWEAALFAAHHNLNNLTVIVDKNDLQAFGCTREVLNLESLEAKWMSFNFDVVTAENGNNFSSLKKAFLSVDKKNLQRPKCIIAKTTKGAGISFMENRMEWHYLPMSDEQYIIALGEIEKEYA